MVCQNDDVGFVDERRYRFGEILIAGCFISRDWDLAKKDIRLGQHGIGNGFSSDTECCGVRWVTVNDTFDVRSVFVNLDMQQDFACPFQFAGELLTRHIDSANIFWRHETFAVPRRSAKNCVLIDADRNIAFIGSGKALGIDSFANVANALFQFFNVGHADH